MVMHGRQGEVWRDVAGMALGGGDGEPIFSGVMFFDVVGR